MVSLEGIAFGYGKRGRLFEGLDLTLTPGNVYGLLGRNGAGKTTLLRLMSGLLFPKAGSARVAGEEVRRRTPAFLRELYFVPEEFHTPALSARALVRLYGVFYPRFDHAAMERYLAELEIDPTQSMTDMSYGQKDDSRGRQYSIRIHHVETVDGSAYRDRSWPRDLGI